MRIGRWSEPRFFFVCQFLDVSKEADANETSGEDGLALPRCLVGESQLRISKLNQISYSPIGCLSYLSR